MVISYFRILVFGYSLLKIIIVIYESFCFVIFDQIGCVVTCVHVLTIQN